MSDVYNLSIKKFECKTIPEHPVVVCIAKRRSGKSFLIRDWLYQLRKRYTAGIVMSATEDGNRFYEKMGVPKAFIYTEFDEAALEKLVEKQRLSTKKGTATPIFVVLDDIAYNKSIFQKSVIRYVCHLLVCWFAHSSAHPLTRSLVRTLTRRLLLMNGRHFKISLFLMLQYALDTPPAVRANIDFVVLLKDNLHREKLYKSFFNGLVPTFGLFNTLMDSCTDDFKALVLDNSSHSTKLSELIFWYRAKKRDKFKIGSKAYYDFSKRKSKDEDDDDDQKQKHVKRKGSVKLLR